MTTQEKQKATTAYGEIEYETVDCENCGNGMMVDDAIYVGIGLHEKSCNGASICDATHQTYRESVPLCEYCAENTVGYSGRIRQELNRPKSILGYLTVLGTALVGTVFGYALSVEPVGAMLTVMVAIGFTAFLLLMAGDL